jgi:transposase
MNRYELDDEQWARVEAALPPARGRGRRCRDRRTVVDAMLWVARTGAPWRDLPERYGPWSTAYYHFCRRTDQGAWDVVLAAMQDEMRERGHIDEQLWCVDGSIVRAARSAAGGGKKGGPASPRTTPLGVHEAAWGRSCTW